MLRRTTFAALLCGICASYGAAESPAQTATSTPLGYRVPQRAEVIVDGHPLTVWFKRPPSPRGAILLVHGRTWSTLPNFDLRVPGRDYSIMDRLVDRGYAAYGVDLRGYGATARDFTGWLSPFRAANDQAAVLRWIVGREPSLRKPPVLLGYSQGALTASLTAQLHPDTLSALILYAFTRDLDTRPTFPPPPTAPPRQPTTAEQAGSDFRTSDAVSPDVVNAYVRMALASDPVRADWRDLEQFQMIDPAKVRVPTLLLHGANDPATTVAKDAKVLSRLGTQDRSLVILPNSDHAAHVENSQSAWIDAILAFIERPRSSAEGAANLR